MKITGQFLRYAVVGVANNAIGYSLYLLLSYWGLGHKTAMTLLYIVGTIQTFFFNRKWTFRHEGGVSSSMVRYALAYFAGYVINIAGLLIFVDQWGWPHRWVQAGLVVTIACFLFLVQRYWVFASNAQPIEQQPFESGQGLSS